MSLVDYGSSSEDETSENREHKPENEHGPASFTIPQNTHSSGRRSGSVEIPSTSCIGKLPDAFQLLNSPSVSSVAGAGTDHASRVAVAMAKGASRKRDSTGFLSSTLPRNKAPKGNLPNTKSVPDTDGGVLVPPQLKGRSNIVTEDIGKLFVRKHVEPPPQQDASNIQDSSI